MQPGIVFNNVDLRPQFSTKAIEIIVPAKLVAPRGRAAIIGAYLLPLKPAFCIIYGP